MGARVSVLEDRHIELGATMADWNDMSVAWTYATSNDEEHAAVREKAGLLDLSALKKAHVKGPDAEAAVDYLLPRDMTKLEPGRAVYSTILNEKGGIDDDAIVYRLGQDHFLIVYGTGECEAAMNKAVAGRNANWNLDDDMHCLSLQGPVAVDFLNQYSELDVHALKYFGQTETKLFGMNCLLARTGYTGERGYDIFASANVAGDIWDQILDKGTSLGIKPFSFVCLNTVRIEAGLLFYPFDMNTEHTPWEAGLGWSVAIDKSADYIGKVEVLNRRDKESTNFVGIIANHDAAIGEPIAGGEVVLCNDKSVGVVTASLFSNRLNKSIALAQVEPSCAPVGTDVQVKGADKIMTGKISALPFYDPKKLRPRGLA